MILNHIHRAIDPPHGNPRQSETAAALDPDSARLSRSILRSSSAAVISRAGAGIAAVILLATVGGHPARANDPAEAARQAGEPPLGEIFQKLGYSTDAVKDEIPAQLFTRAGDGPVTFKPIAAFGLPKVCSAGWYVHPPEGSQSGDQKGPEADQAGFGAGRDIHTTLLWQTGEKDNKRYSPPVVPGGKTTFDPGGATFGLWVSTAGFKDETICTEDALQRFDPRFKADDRHKAHVYPARNKDGKLLPNTYLIGWEYSTNDDNQDMVTLVSNVKPAR